MSATAAAACHTTGPQPSAPGRSWAADPRAPDKDALLEYAREHPELFKIEKLGVHMWV